MNPLLQRYVPPVAAIVAVVAFVNLGLWQLDRAAEKEARQALFSEETGHRPLASIGEPVEFAGVEATGRLLADRQILIDNIVKNGRLGYYVITPLEYSRSAPLLLVNRGFIDRSAVTSEADALDVAGDRMPIRGRIGRLPRVGVRGGPGFADPGAEWPLVAVYPTADEVAEVLDRDVMPWILLLSPDDERGYLRDWRPEGSGPSTHYGYAFQWFAMAVAVIAIAGWHYGRRRRRT